MLIVSLLSLRLHWTLMFRLVNTDLSASGKRQGSNLAPTLFVYVRDRHVLCFEIAQCSSEVIAHEEKFMPVVLLGIVERGLKWRHSENQPAVASINAGKLEHIAKENPAGFGILGIDNDMCSIDQT
jgi:hypothetical protein